MIKQILQGIVVGVANIIPGVSGGTMMVAMGLYDKLIHAVTHIKSEFKQSMKLLIPIFVGVGLAIALLSKLFTFLLENYPIPTNFAFCGLIAGSLPFILNKIKGSKVTIEKIIPFIVFFGIVIAMALMAETSSGNADMSLNVINIVKLFFVGVIAAATMVIPGISGSMMLMLLGYYDTILKTISDFISALTKFDIDAMLKGIGVLMPFGIGVIVGVIVIAKLIEFIFTKAQTHAYFAISGLIIASPIAILIKTDWSDVAVLPIVIGIFTFIAGWFVASKLGGE